MKELSYLFQAFNALALLVKIVIAILLATTLIGAAAFCGVQVALIVALGLLLLAILFALYLLLSFWVRRRQSAELKGDLVTTAAHRGVLDPAARSRLISRSQASGLECGSGTAAFGAAGGVDAGGTLRRATPALLDAVSRAELAAAFAAPGASGMS